MQQLCVRCAVQLESMKCLQDIFYVVILYCAVGEFYYVAIPTPEISMNKFMESLL